MNNTYKNIGSILAQYSIKYRWYVIFISIFASLLLASGAKNLVFSTNYRIFFSSENPNLLAFEALQDTYTKSDNIIYVLKPKNGKAFQPMVLKAVQEITKESWKLPYATRVDSVTNYQHTKAENDDLIVGDLVEKDPYVYTKKELNSLEKVALNEPQISGRLISKDALTTGVNITLTLTSDDPLEGLKVAEAATKLESTFKEKYPEIEFAISGIAMMNNAFQASATLDLKNLVPIMYFILFATIALFLRSFFATLITLFLGLLSIISGMGIGGWLGFPLTPPTSMVPTIILTLAVADSVHIYTLMFKNMKNGLEHHAAIIESLRLNFIPVMLTSLTTGVGFLALNFSDAPPFHHLGTLAAIGVLIAFILSVTFVPALISLVPYKGDTKRHFFDHFMYYFGEFVIKHQKKLLIIMGSVVVGLSFLIPRLELNDEFIEYFGHEIDFRNDTDFLLQNLTGLYQAEYSLGAKNSGGINEPLYLNNLEKFIHWLKKQPEVQHVYSLADMMKRLNKNMHNDDERFYQLPERRDLAAQYLLLYEMSLPYGLDLNDRINIDKSATRVTATLYDMSTVQIRAFKKRSEDWIKENLPPYMHTHATSVNLMFAFISKNNLDSMSKGNMIALLCISLIIMLSLKSFRIGLFSLIPNIVPLIIAFGTWSLLYEQINMAVATVTSVSLGIIVDDTVHFLSKYQRAIVEKGLDATEAVRYAFSTVGSALIITSIALIAGFVVMLFSSFQVNTTFGLLTALCITAALFADFLLLPPLLMLLDKRNRKKI